MIALLACAVTCFSSRTVDLQLQFFCFLICTLYLMQLWHDVTNCDRCFLQEEWDLLCKKSEDVAVQYPLSIQAGVGILHCRLHCQSMTVCSCSAHPAAAAAAQFLVQYLVSFRHVVPAGCLFDHVQGLPCLFLYILQSLHSWFVSLVNMYRQPTSRACNSVSHVLPGFDAVACCRCG
jgi:hypothetical protein